MKNKTTEELMKNKTTEELKKGLKDSVSKGYRIEDAIKHYWQQVDSIASLVKGTKVSMAVSTAVAGIFGFGLAGTAEYNDIYKTGVDIFTEYPGFVAVTAASLVISLASTYGLTKLSKKQKETETVLEKREGQLEKQQTITDEIVKELGTRGVYPKFRTKFITSSELEDTDEEEDEQNLNSFSKKPQAPIRYKNDSKDKYFYEKDPVVDEDNSLEVAETKTIVDRDSYKEKYFPSETAKDDVLVESQPNELSSQNEGDIADFLDEYFKKNR